MPARSQTAVATIDLTSGGSTLGELTPGNAVRSFGAPIGIDTKVSAGVGSDLVPAGATQSQYTSAYAAATGQEARRPVSIAAG